MENNLTLIIIPSLVTLIVSSYITYLVTSRTQRRSRLDSLSQTVFLKRMDACERIFSALLELRFSASTWVTMRKRPEADLEALKVAEKEYLQDTLDMLHAVNRASLHVDRETGLALFSVGEWATQMARRQMHSNFDHYSARFFEEIRRSHNLLRDRSGLAKFHVEFDALLAPGDHAQTRVGPVAPEAKELVESEIAMIDRSSSPS